MNTLELICQLPRALRVSQTKSSVQLLKESGYSHSNSALSTEEIEKYLRAHPELLMDWITYSGDKRTTSGWYFDVDKASNTSVVGFHPKGDVFKFSDQFKACAKFIYMEIDEIGKHAG